MTFTKIHSFDLFLRTGQQIPHPGPGCDFESKDEKSPENNKILQVKNFFAAHPTEHAFQCWKQPKTLPIHGHILRLFHA